MAFFLSPQKGIIRTILKESLKIRNYLVHDFFQLHINKSATQKGREWLINHFLTYRKKMQICDKMLTKKDKDIRDKIGLTDEWFSRTAEKIKEDSRQKYTDIEYNEE